MRHDRKQPGHDGPSAPTWSQVLRALRKSAGITQDGWAARLGYGPRTIQRWERGEIPPDAAAAATLVRLCTELQLFRDFGNRPLVSPALSPDTLNALLAEARIGQRAHLESVGPDLSSLYLHRSRSTFIGREQEVQQLSGSVRTARLLTLTGPGGVGKSRLALEVAWSVRNDFANGVALAELASVSEPALLPNVIASTLGVPERPGRSVLASVIEAIRGFQVLLVLDNCEHVACACADLIPALLDSCPELHVLAISRVVLRLTGEKVWPVGPLSLPDPTRIAYPESVLRSEAVQLFLDRARGIAPGFPVTGNSIRSVGDLCRRLDGLPLAIEVAASWMHALSAEEVHLQLERSADFLDNPMRDAPARHRTLWATLDWSYSLLAEQEQRLLASLSVFAGGATLDAIEMVGARALGIDSGRIGNILARLVEASLVQRVSTAEGESRFSLLQTIRDYAHHQLARAGHEQHARSRHAEYFRVYAESARSHLLGPEAKRWLDRLERDHDNLRTAVSYALDKRDVELAGHLCGNLWVFWYFRGHLREGQSMLRAILALMEDCDLHSATRMQLLQGSAMFDLHHGSPRTARADAEEAVAIGRRLCDPKSLAEALEVLGFTARVQGEVPLARSVLRESASLARAANHPFIEAAAVLHLGLIALEADDDCTTASTLLERSLALAQQSGNRRIEANALGAMGRAARAQGDVGRSAALLSGAVRAAAEVGDVGLMPLLLEEWAILLCEQGQFAQGVRLASISARLRELVGSRRYTSLQRELQHSLTRARKALGEEQYAATWAGDQAVTPEMVLGEVCGLGTTTETRLHCS